MTKRKPTRQNGFTMLEIIVSLALFVIVIILVSSIYLLAQKSYNKSSDLAELTQNARVCLDRLSRELRQSVNIVTALPPTDSDPENPPAEEIFFQDGHNISQITYLRYYLDGTNLMRKHTAYHFASEPTIYVTYNTTDQYGNSPDEKILENRIIGEYFSQLKFWDNSGSISIAIELNKGSNNFKIRTSVYPRN